MKDTMILYQHSQLSLKNGFLQPHSFKQNQSIKPNLHVRLCNLPICPELTRDKTPRAKDIGRFLSFSGACEEEKGLFGFMI